MWMYVIWIKQFVKRALSAGLKRLIYMQIPVQGPLFTKLYTICLFVFCVCNDGVLEIHGDATQINRKLRRLHSRNSFPIGAGSHV